MYRITRHISRRTALLSSAVLVFLFTLWFIGTHGLLTVTNQHKETPIVYGTFNDNLEFSAASTNRSTQLVPANNYTIQTQMKNGAPYLKNASVSGFLATLAVDTPDREAYVETIVRSTYTNLALKNNTLISWNENGTINDISKSDEVSFSRFPAFSQVIQLNNHILGGIITADDSSRLVLYNTTTGESNILASLKTSSVPSLRPESGGFSVFNQDKGSFHFYNLKASTANTVANFNAPISLYNEQPLYSYNGSKLAVITGGSFSDSNDDNNTYLSSADLALNILTASNKKQSTSINLHRSQVRNIMLSPKGGYIAVITNQSFAIYSTVSAERVISIPYVVNQFLWNGDNEFVFSTTDKGVFSGSIKNREVWGLLPYQLLRPTRLSFIDNNSLYLTGYSSLNEATKAPDAYRLSLQKTSNDTERKIFRAFPHSGDGYQADYIDKKVIIKLSRYIYSSGTFDDPKAKAEALKYVNDIFKGNKPAIDYQYTTTDLRTAPYVDN